MSCTNGRQGKLCVEPGTSAVFDNSSVGFEFLSETLTASEEKEDLRGMKGSRFRDVEDEADGTYDVEGSVTLKISPGDLNFWLPYILGATEVADTFDLAQDLPIFAVMVDRVASMGTSKTFEYHDCKISQAIFRAASNQPLTLELGMMAKREIKNVNPFPAGVVYPTDPVYKPYRSEDSGMTYAGANLPAQSWELIINNFLRRERELTIEATDFCPDDLEVMFSSDTPWRDDTAPRYDIDEAAGALVFFNALATTIFTFGRMTQRKQSPNITAPGRIPWALNLEAKGVTVGGEYTPPLSVTNVIT